MAAVGFSSKDAARIVRAVKILERQMKSVVASDRRANPHRVSSTAGAIKIAKAQEDLSGNTDKLSVKLFDAAGATPGDAFDVYIVAGKGSVDTDDYAPGIDDEDVVFVAKIYSDWYLIPGLLELDDCE